MFKSDRNFRLWDFRVSHNQLLIRSPSTREISTNVDLVFWGVEFMSIPTALNGLEITRTESKNDDGLNFKPPSNGSMFLIETASTKNVVVAAGCKVLKNTLDIFDSSLEGFAATDQNRDLGEVLARF
ncbi:hypothetical protein ACYFX5_09955 [Bremerella sp. T1]|uniref:hypothetical protein n=1 Tax=Bremerella sp. TYQ1 TaxID=3119568 RepID=UPI001CCC8041|nr:hypothetical protein [Bremerella volcania]UBM38576.1 hypothetical protein LA756_11895 [Bremerella volcania]